MPTPKPERCESTTVLWPDVEALDARCAKPAGHEGWHRDDDFEWNDETGDERFIEPAHCPSCHTEGDDAAGCGHWLGSDPAPAQW